MPKQVVILFGPPGAGKGTQAELVAEKLGLYIFETSKILEKEFRRAENLPESSQERYAKIDGENFDVLKEKKLWENGTLNSPPWVTFLVVKETTKLYEEDKELILAGSPRTVYEVERVMPALEKLYGKENIKVILIEISPEETIFRNSHRRICELVRHSILFNKETEKLKTCPIDGSKLIKRKNLDDPETIKVRIKEYTERTFPMLEYFEKHNFEVSKIKGEQTPSDVFNDILKAING